MSVNHQSTPELSILIASWNSRRDLEPCLKSVTADCSVPYEIIVIDNGSTDESVPFLKEHYPQARIIVNQVNEGHCRAINQGLSAARGQYVMILDADTVVMAGAIERLMEAMRAANQAAILAPRMLNPDGSLQETARSFPKAINGLFGRQSFLTRLFPHNRFSEAYLRRQTVNDINPFEVDWVSAACMIFPQSLTRQIGFWDEGFKGYWVDADWCMRARRAGVRVYCVPASRVIHHEQNRQGKRKSARRIISFHRGVNRFYRQHYTRGYADPRAIMAGAALSVRALLLLTGNLLLHLENLRPQSLKLKRPEPAIYHHRSTEPPVTNSPTD